MFGLAPFGVLRAHILVEDPSAGIKFLVGFAHLSIDAFKDD